MKAASAVLRFSSASSVRRIRSGLPHVLCRCSALQDWCQNLNPLRCEGSRDLVSEEGMEILACSPSSPWFVHVLRFAKEIDIRTRTFWMAASP